MHALSPILTRWWKPCHRPKRIKSETALWAQPRLPDAGHWGRLRLVPWPRNLPHRIHSDDESAYRHCRRHVPRPCHSKWRLTWPRRIWVSATAWRYWMMSCTSIWRTSTCTADCEMAMRNAPRRVSGKTSQKPRPLHQAGRLSHAQPMYRDRADAPPLLAKKTMEKVFNLPLNPFANAFKRLACQLYMRRPRTANEFQWNRQG